MVVSCPVNDTTGVCSTMEAVGSGIGVLLQSLVQVLPIFLLILVLVAGAGAIIFAIANVIKNSVTKYSHR